MAREREVVKRIRAWLDSLGEVEHRKLHIGWYGGTVGDSDIIGTVFVNWRGIVTDLQAAYLASEHGCGDGFGWTFLIECKKIGERPTKIQEKRIKQWQAAGALAGYAASVEEAREILLPALILRGDA